MDSKQNNWYTFQFKDSGSLMEMSILPIDSLFVSLRTKSVVMLYQMLNTLENKFEVHVCP